MLHNRRYLRVIRSDNRWSVSTELLDITIAYGLHGVGPAPPLDMALVEQGVFLCAPSGVGRCDVFDLALGSAVQGDVGDAVRQ